MRFRFLLIILFALCATSFLLPNQIYAANNIAVDVVPPNPNPNESVTLSISSYDVNLDTNMIAWSVNGKVVLSGIGKKSFSTVVGAAETTTNITISVKDSGGTVEQKITLRPNPLTLLWQANDSYVPPFYKGKALASPGSEIKVVAMPEIKKGSGFLKSDSLIYSWKEDYNNDTDGSGYGKNFYTYVNDYLDGSNVISVTAATIDETYSAEAAITVGTVTPKISFYIKDPSLGTIWDRALQNNIQVSGEVILSATPYFISPKNILSSRLIYSWFINDVLTNTENLIANLLPLKVQAGQSGNSKIRLDVESKDKIFESANKTIYITF